MMHKDILGTKIILIANKEEKCKLIMNLQIEKYFHGNISLKKAHLPEYTVECSSWSTRTSLEHDSCRRLIQRLYLH